MNITVVMLGIAALIGVLSVYVLLRVFGAEEVLDADTCHHQDCNPE